MKNRTYKFRAWDKKKNKMYYGREDEQKAEYYGNYVGMEQ